MSLFDTDKTDLLMFVLDRYDVRYKAGKVGWQKVRCLNDAMHKTGDKNPSASVHLGKGYYNCFACDMSGDGYQLLQELEGMTVKDVNSMTSLTPRKGQEDESEVWV